MAKIATRKLTTTIGGVTGPEVKVELEPLGHGQRFRLIAVAVFTLIFIASLVQPTILEFGVFNKTVLEGQWWRVITYAFLHGGWVHLAMNMLACFVFARVVQMHYGPNGAGGNLPGHVGCSPSCRRCCCALKCRWSARPAV